MRSTRSPQRYGFLSRTIAYSVRKQAAAHDHVGLGFAEASDVALANGLLSGVALAERHGGLAQGPAQRGGAGLGDVAALRAAGRLFQVGSQARPKLERVGVRETLERSDLGGDDQGPNVADSRHSQQDQLRVQERFAARCQEDSRRSRSRWRSANCTMST